MVLLFEKKNVDIYFEFKMMVLYGRKNLKFISNLYDVAIWRVKKDVDICFLFYWFCFMKNRCLNIFEI
jgi:hypothetical protein